FGASNRSDPDVTRSFCRQARCSTNGTRNRPNRDRSNKELTMKLFVIGATGGTGREIVQQALARGHHVTAFVRSPETVTFRYERISVIKGNVTDENQLAEAVQNHDAVLSALGPREVFKPSSLLHNSALATTREMSRS